MTDTWARVMLLRPSPTWQANQICYLTSEYGLTSQSLDLTFEAEYELKFWMEGSESQFNETYPVVLSGYFSPRVLEAAIVEDRTNGCTNSNAATFVPLLSSIVFIYLSMLV